MSEMENTTELRNALASSRKSLSTSLQALRNDPPATSDRLPPLVPGLADVFAQLLTSVRHTTTALSLAFKPPITVPATIAQLDKLSDQLGRLISCVVAAASGEPWNLSALVDEWRDGVLAISTEVDRYLEVLEKSVTAGPSDSSYLMHTGMVWEEIDRVEKGLSANELQAVVKRWEGEKDVVKDAWTEFKEFLENDDVNELDDDDDEDGEWGELQWAMSGGKLTVEGKARAEAAKPLLGLQHILHATLPRFLPILSPETTYRPLLAASSEFVGAFDSAVSAMYPEQDKAEIESTMSELERKSCALIDCVRERTTDEQCSTFLARWEARLSQEIATWTSRTLSLSSLKEALS